VALAAQFAAHEYRVGMYSGAFWHALHEGAGEQYERIAEQEGKEPAVEWALDPAAKHCEDCPPRAKVYPNWDALVREAGLPGSGQTRCLANCRCRIRLIDGKEKRWF